MKKTIQFLLLSSVLFFTSCLEITETVTMTKKGKGNYSFAIDATKMMEQMEALSAMDTTGTMMSSIEHSLDSTFNDIYLKYQDKKGITNVKYDKSKQHIYVISCDFDSFEALTNVTNQEGKGSKFEWKKGKLARSGNLALNPEELGGEDNEMAGAMLAEMKYKTVWIMPSKVKKASNKTAIIEGNTVTIETNFKDLGEGKESLENVVEY